MTDDPRTPATDPAETDPTRIDSEPPAEDAAFSNDHPLASPNELAGDAMSGIELEFAARELADAEGAASGMMLDDADSDAERDTLPLEGN